MVESTGGSMLATGFTSFTYHGTSGSSYVVSVSDYGNYHFVKWSNGNTNRYITVSAGTSLVAYYTG